jgi:hypothetical protein
MFIQTPAGAHLQPPLPHESFRMMTYNYPLVHLQTHVGDIYLRMIIIILHHYYRLIQNN